MPRVTFNDREYKTVHVKSPRGFGVWAFMPNTADDWMFSPPMKFTDAKKWAREEAPEATEFKVGP